MANSDASEESERHVRSPSSSRPSAPSPRHPAFERIREASDGGEPEKSPRPPAPVSRRSHAKSKTGCRTCKRRKIKCDEHRPSCRNCIRHGVACDFEAQASANGALNGSASKSFPNRNASSAPCSNQPADLNMLDLELMYNFTTFTFATLANDPSLRQMLKTTAVKMGMDNDYLMRMILAVSALHLAHYRPSRKVQYLQRALEHHAAANRKAISLMTDLKKEDCESLHLFSVLTLFFALGWPREEQSSFILGESVVPNWLALVRGTEPIIEILNPSTYKGPLAPLFEYGRSAWRKLYGSEQARNPASLMELQDQVSRSCKDDKVLSTYLATIDHLRHILGMIIPSARIGGGDWNMGSMDGYHTGLTPVAASSQGPRLEPWDALVFTWHMVDFLSLLQVEEPQQEALAIFAHILVVFKKLESQWWLEGWATHVMERVWALLDDEHKLWTQWPIEEIGWVPP